MAIETITNDKPVVKMHIKVQLKNLIIGFTVFLVVFIGLCVAVGFGIASASAFDNLTRHTAKVLVLIKDADAAQRSASNAGRALVTGESEGVEAQRQNALNKIGELRKLVSDNPVQIENCNVLEQKARDGFKAQDLLYSTAKFNSGKFQIDDSARQVSMKANDELALAFFTVRSEEQSLLIQRQEVLSAYRWQIIRWVVLALVLVLIAAIVLFGIAVRGIKRAAIVSGRVQKVNKELNNPELEDIVEFINEAKSSLRLTLWNLFTSL